MMPVGIGGTILGSMVKCVHDFDCLYSITCCDMLARQVFSKLAVTLDYLRALGR